VSIVQTTVAVRFLGLSCSGILEISKNDLPASLQVPAKLRQPSMGEAYDRP